MVKIISYIFRHVPATISALFAFTCIYSSALLAQEGLKLIIDDGRYTESKWSRQLAVTPDDRYLISSDINNGVRIRDLETGRLVNTFEGHSLEGDAYYDRSNNLFISTGDRKIKVWDIENQKLLKTIKQGFHSQFMENVYVDSKKEYIYAQNVKYGYDTKKIYRTYKYEKMFFFDDRYYVFDMDSGAVKGFSVFTEKQETAYTLTDYKKGISEYFNYFSGHLFIGYTDGVRIVDIRTGNTDFAAFDRSNAYRNLSELSSFALSSNGRYLIAGAEQDRGHLVILEKVNQDMPFQNNVREIFRRQVAVGEILNLHHSNRFVFSTGNTIALMDIDTRKVVWQTSSKILKISNIKLNDTGKDLYAMFGRSQHVNRHSFGRDFDLDFDQYFDSIDPNWGEFKSHLKKDEIPSEILDQWTSRPRTGLIPFYKTWSVTPENKQIAFSEGTLFSPLEGRVYSPSGRYYCIENGENIEVYDGNKKIVSAPSAGVTYQIEYSLDETYVAFGGSGRRVTVINLTTRKVLKRLNGESYITSITFSPDNRYLFTGSLKNEIIMWRLATGVMEGKFIGSDGAINATDISPDSKTLLSVSGDGALRFWDVKSKKLLLTVFYNHKYEYIAFTPEGYYEKSDAFDAVYWNYNNKMYAFDQCFEDFYHPGLIGQMLGEETKPLSKKTVSEALKSYPPPWVQILTPVMGKKIKEKYIDVVIALKDNGGGIDEVKLLHNGKRVSEEMRGVKVLGKSNDPTKTYRIALLAGENKLSASAFSKGRVESPPHELTVIYEGMQAKADAYILVVGINDYKNSRYDLNYARADAQALHKIIKNKSRGLFRNVHDYIFYDTDATSENILNALAKIMDKAREQDMFVFYFAGHGMMVPDVNDVEKFYLAPTDLTSLFNMSKVNALGISGGTLKQYSQNIKARKQLFIFDACQSGGIGETFSRRGAAEEKALAQLSRSAGIHILASTNAEQFATEFGELGHGIFTYVLLDALEGRADGTPPDGKITIYELKAFIDDQLPEMTQRYKGNMQYPVVYSRGQDFPVIIR